MGYFSRIWLILFIFGSLSAKAQLDLEHWLPPISWFTKGGGSNEVYESKLYLSTPHETPFLVKVFDGEQVITSVMLSKKEPFVLDISSDIYFTADKFLFTPIKRGLHVAGANSFYASYRISTNIGDEIVTSKGKTAIGKNFLIAGGPSFTEKFGAFFTSIYATQNNTKVTIINKEHRIIFDDGQTHDQFSFILNKGESYSIKVTAPQNYSEDVADFPYAFSNDIFNTFIGTEIISDKAVAVLNGNSIGQVSAETSTNLLYDQSIPIKNLGESYFIRSGFSTSRGLSEGVLIIATEDNTAVYFNDEKNPLILNKGQYYMSNLNFPNKFIEHDASNEDPQRNTGLFIKASAKIYCYQFTAGNGNQYKGSYFANFCQSMSLVLPLNSNLPGTIDDIPQFSKIGSKTSLDSRITVLLPTGDRPNINGVTSSNNNGPFNIKGTNAYKYFQIKIPKNTQKDLKIRAKSGLVLNIIAGHEKIAPLDFEDAKGFASYYTGFSNDPYILVNGNCIQEQVTLTLNNIDFEAFQWQKNGIDIPGATSTSYIPSASGSYTCKLSYSTFTYTTPAVDITDCPYSITTKDLGTICPNFFINPKFTTPNEQLTISKVEILSQPNHGVATIDGNQIKIGNESGFTGDDRLVYKITAPNIYYEIVKTNFSLYQSPVADVKSSLLNLEIEGNNFVYDLNSAINNANSEKFQFYKTEQDADLQRNEILTTSKYITNYATEVFVRVSTNMGCFVIKSILLEKMPQQPASEFTLENAFTPNGDGKNDVWDYSILKNFTNLTLSVLDRYGNVVYKRPENSTDYFWNGKDSFNNPCKTGTYWVNYAYSLNNNASKIVKTTWVLLKNRN